MRPNSQNKNRSRNRNGGRKHTNPLSRNYESNGPDVKVRGNAAHIAEKYTQLARDAQSSGDSVMAENYLQHAEHYYRIVMAAQPQNIRPDNSQDSDDDFEGDEDRGDRFASRSERVPERQEAESEAEPAPANASANASVNADASSDAAPAETADAQSAGEGDADQPRKRERRPRRRRAAAGENGADPANAPQPEVGELPAFITAGGTTPAE
ncbi:DUF4167 domain-containing protein [Devosia nitrariae]|uniref:DUF4167 domain-containing protein n=1 Tax=Devosia nitrariae TaxID=2071872 RepID=A0ABQ5W2H6_9HYPH|nr:hypothetical protein GCM10010862_13410 [Devosia nitrariae]